MSLMIPATMVRAGYPAVRARRVAIARRRASSGVAAVIVMCPILRPGLAVDFPYRCSDAWGSDSAADQSGSPPDHRSPSRLTMATAGAVSDESPRLAPHTALT